MTLRPVIDQPLGAEGSQAEDGISRPTAAFCRKHHHDKTNDQPSDHRERHHAITRYAPYHATARSNYRVHAYWSIDRSRSAATQEEICDARGSPPSGSP